MPDAWFRPHSSGRSLNALVDVDVVGPPGGIGPRAVGTAAIVFVS